MNTFLAFWGQFSPVGIVEMIRFFSRDLQNSADGKFFVAILFPYFASFLQEFKNSFREEICNKEY